MRSYSTPLIAQANELKRYWEYLWTKEDKRGAALYLSILFIWSFPVFCFFTHPFWSLASIILLALYRFFSKIVFQESWGAIALHPFGVLFWIATFFWWAIESFKTKYSNT
jgi:hypothetical protein